MMRAFYYANTNYFIVRNPRDSLTGAAITSILSGTLSLFDKATGAAIAGGQNLPVSVVGINLQAVVPVAAASVLAEKAVVRAVLNVQVTSTVVLSKEIEARVVLNDA